MEKQVPRGVARVLLKVNAHKHYLEMYSSKETLEEAYAAIDCLVSAIGEDLKRDVAYEHALQAFCRKNDLY